MYIQTPYLIQRGKIATPLAERSERFSKAVSLDYMGSAEFEFGALPASLRTLEAGERKIRVFNDIKEGESPLRVLSIYNDAEYDEYAIHLLDLRKGSIRLKEFSGFDENRRESWLKVDLWWDINNHVMWSFNKNFMNRLEDYLIASFKYMNEQKAQREAK